MKFSTLTNLSFTLLCLFLVTATLQGQNVGININNPSASLHVVGSSIRYENGVNRLDWTILGFETSLISQQTFKINAPTMRLSANAFSFNPGFVTIGGTYSAQQQLDVNGGIKIGSTFSGTDGTLRYNNNKFEGFINGNWKELIQELTFTTNSTGNLIHTTNDHLTEPYDFIVGDDQLPTNNYNKTLMLFDISKGAFRAGQLTNSSAWEESNIGSRSFAVGQSNFASGNESFAAGASNVAAGNLSTVFGNSNKANTDYSFVTGISNITYSPYEMIIGRYSETYTPGSSTTWTDSDRLFVIGNGSGVANRNNLLTVKKNGETRLDGDFFIGKNEDMPAVSIYEKESGGNVYGEMLMLNEFSERSDKRSILMSANGSNNEPFFEMRRKNGSIGIILDVDVSGDARITTDELQIKGGSDFAEYFDIDKDDSNVVRPGMLVSINPDIPGQLMLSKIKEDAKLVGIVSGANGVETGVTMGQEGSIADGEYPIALSGRVYVYANAEGGKIIPGDYLTSSSTPGHAMKADMDNPKWGSLIGKAMTPIDKNGFVLVLVNLQ